MHRLGAHVSTSGGFEKALQKLHDMGGNTIQFFSTSPRGWNKPSITDEAAESFQKTAAKLDISPVYFHASYLINLADPGSTGHMSKEVLTAELEMAHKMGVYGSIVHTGSFKNAEGEVVEEAKYKVLYKHIKEILANTPDDTAILLENAGNRKIGLKLEELGKIIKAVDSKRVQVCLDTCHLHAGGYDLSTKESFEAFLEVCDKVFGLERIALFHINDSRDPFGSLRDRHDNLGKGMVGEAVFKNIVNNPKTASIPLILEVPGLDDKGPDKANLDVLKSYVA